MWVSSTTAKEKVDPRHPPVPGAVVTRRGMQWNIAAADARTAITERLYGGGRIHSPAHVGHVELTLAGRTRLTDDADAGVALFLADEGVEPVRVEIYDTDARLLATHGTIDPRAGY